MDRKTASAIERVITAPVRKYTKQEALDVLKKHGVLTDDNHVSEAYRKIIVQKFCEVT